MGRDWYWSGKSSSSTGTAAKKGSETPGCMSGVLHLFDFHQFQFPMTQPPCFKPSSLPQQDPTSSVKGVNAPRNSLESNEGVNREGLEVKQEDFDISVELRKEAGHVKTRIDDQLSCSDSSNSPGPKTPSLVARLMGLDILPDSVSSSSSPSSVKLNNVRQIQNMNKIKKQKMNFGENENTGSRSLPDTPRISSARRSDVDPRHSLQIYREYIPSSGELEYSGRISKDQKSRKRELRNEEENRSPGHYARQIVKQVKESVSRRVGLDITNTITTTPTNARLNSKDVELVILKSKKPKRLTKIGEESNTNKHSNSPRLRLCGQEPPPPPPPRAILTEKIRNSTSAINQKKSKLHQVPQQEKCKKASCERFAQPTKSKTRTSRTVSTSASASSSGNDDQGSKPGSRLSSSSSRITCATPALHDRDNFADEIRYVSEILKCTGIHNDTLVSFTRWYSPSHPLDPSLFSYLENFGSSPVPRWNRRLMFDLVDEILVGFIRPYLNMKPWVESRLRRKEMRGEQLLQHLCYEISSFPSSNCQTLEDIDELVGKDLPSRGELCAESIVVEVERDILDTLVHEVAAEVVGVSHMGDVVR